MPTKDGGPELLPGGGVWSIAMGPTLRDYFAASALEMLKGDWFTGPEAEAEAIARKAWRIADAMLKARGGK